MSLFIDKAWIPAKAAFATAARDVARGAAILGRGTIGLVGVSTLAAALLLLGSEQARDRLMETVLSVAGVALAESSAAAPPEALRIDADPRAQRWSEWLAARPVGAVEPAQEHVTRYLARRYRVAENAVRQIVGQAFSTGRSIGVDPMLILAVTAVESSLNPFAQSPVGAQGLMQILTRVHSDKFVTHGGDHAALDPIANLQVGAEILKDLIRRGGSVERGLQLYVGAGNLSDDGGYAARVLGEMGRIKLAAAGEVRAALSAGLRADNAADGSPAAELVPATAAPVSPDATRQAI